MGGVLPKNPKTRARMNKASTKATLRADPIVGVPDLPKRAEGDPWHPRTLAWWKDLWESPISDELLKYDVHGLIDLAFLQDRYNNTPDGELMKEIRQQRACYGLTPIDRRRLDWVIEDRKPAEDEQQHGAAEQPTKAADPRNVLQYTARK